MSDSHLCAGAEGGDPEVPAVGGEEEAHRELRVRQEHHTQGEKISFDVFKILERQ